MPRPIGVIQKPGFFEDILTRFGINRPQQAFMLDGDVVPVILVDSSIAFTAAPTPAYSVTDIFTVGIVVAPAINTILADTGPLPVGPYTVQWILMVRERSILAFEWRDAGNAANLWAQELETPGIGEDMPQFSTRLNIENAGERFRVRVDTGGGVGIQYQASILAKI